MNRRLNWGMLSTARIGQELVPEFRESQSSELVAVASRELSRAREYAQAHGISRFYGSYQELLEDEAIDCIYITLPNSLHGEWIRASLEAGKHVLCEKPLTPTAAEAADLFRLAEQSGLVLAEAFMYRHHPKTLQVHELLREGAIGELRTIRLSFAFHVADPSVDIRYRPELAGGALRDVGCYCVSYSTFCTEQEPEHVQGFARLAPSGVDERFYGTLAFPGGAVAQFDCALDLPLTLGVTLVGSGGEIHVPMPWYAHLEPLSVTLRRDEEVVEIPTPGANAYLMEIENFAAVVRREVEPQISAPETIRNLRVIERLMEEAGLT